jgi:two-component system cell cycle sensor histidine kinase/response regulator CckA
VLSRVLTSAGYKVVTVANGAEGVAAATQQSFDLHILDAVMPILSGREACERIRATRPGARFLFTSGYGGDALPASFLRDLDIEMIAKPFDPDTLLRTVRTVLDTAPASKVGIPPGGGGD